MAYSDSTKERAYMLFLHKGLNPESIAKELKKDYPAITANTIRKWAMEGNWYQDRDSLVQKTTERITDLNMSEKMKELEKKSDQLLQSTYDKLIQTSPKISSWEQGIYAFKAISEFYLAMQEKKEKSKDPEKIIQAFFKVINGIPSIKKQVTEHWDSILKEMKSELEIPVEKTIN